MEENELLLAKIKQSQNVNKTELSNGINLLLFEINENLYAIKSSGVKEILKSFEVSPLPFVPSFVKGVLNRYGEPYAVIEPAILFGQNEQTSCVFMVLNHQSKTCIKITSLKEFHFFKTKEISEFSDSEFSTYFDGTVSFEGKTVFIINTEKLINEIGDKIANS